MRSPLNLSDKNEVERLLFEGTAIAIVLLDESGFLDCNNAALQLYNLPGRDAVVGMHPGVLSPLRQPSGQDSFSLAAEYIAKALTDESLEFEWLHERLDGSKFPAQVVLKAVQLGGKKLVQATVIDMSLQKQAEQALSQMTAKFRACFDMPNSLNLMLDESAVLDCNSEVLQTFDAPSVAALNDKHISQRAPTHQPDGESSPDVFTKHLSHAIEKGNHAFEWMFLRLDGSAFPVEVAMKSLQWEGKPAVMAQCRDISAQKNSEQELRIARIAFELHEGVLVTDNTGQIVRVNRAFSEISGYSSDELVGKTPKVFCSNHHTKEFYKNLWAELNLNGFWQGEIWNRHKDGNVYMEWLTISSVTTPEGAVSHYIGIYSDICKQGEAEAAIYRQAYYDVLTSLPNRRLLMDRIEQAIIACKRAPFHGAVIYLDLDKFKALNDTRGHDAGDQLLVEVARRLQLAVREGDTIARLGGDEFVILLENLSGDLTSAIFQVKVIAEKLIESLYAPYRLNGLSFKCSSSLGVRLFNHQDHSVDEVLKHADLAMYEAKRSGGNAVCFFKAHMQNSLNKRSQMRTELHNAIKELQLSLEYQIQVNHQLDVEGVEALLRWNHPEQGLIAPGVFVSLAEESDTIFQIGFWVLETVCKQLKQWQSDPMLAGLTIAVNISVRQFKQHGFVSQIKHLLSKYEINPQQLKLELTENLLLADVNEVIGKMKELSALGVRFSMDDFGVGYSSLSNLKQLPLTQLKIDRSFIQDITTNHSDAAIAKTIIDMSRHLHLDVIAEGVETQEQADCLKQLGCYSYQGFLFSKPLAVDSFERFLKSYR